MEHEDDNGLKGVWPKSPACLKVGRDAAQVPPAARSAAEAVVDRLSVFDHMVTNAYWVKLKSTNHGCFSDFRLGPKPP